MGAAEKRDKRVDSTKKWGEAGGATQAKPECGSIPSAILDTTPEMQQYSYKVPITIKLRMQN
jgi:hypothetical protein